MNKLHHPVRFIFRLAALAAVTGASQAQAAILFSTDFSGASQPGGVGTAIAMGGTAASGITVSNLSAGSGILGFQIDAASTAGLASAPVFAAAAINQNLASDITVSKSNAEYFEFTISADLAMGLETISFNMVKHGTTQSTTISLFSNLDNYAASIGSVTDALIQGVYPLSISLGQLVGFSEAASVTFRFHLFDSFSSTGSNRRLGIDDLVITAVPEPALTGLLLGLLGLGVVLYRRRAA
jgi:hypothetical protein